MILALIKTLNKEPNYKITTSSPVVVIAAKLTSRDRNRTRERF